MHVCVLPQRHPRNPLLGSDSRIMSHPAAQHTARFRDERTRNEDGQESLVERP